MALFSRVLRYISTFIVFVIYYKVDEALTWLLVSFLVAEMIIDSYLAFERKKELLAFIKRVESSIEESEQNGRKDN